ncbi:MAG: hypothetical protein JRJ23_07810, partial [Deltaproteobacteria bacterium]|nr:hypothetical protein [Deltaproteobacteria bacterium]
MKGPTQSKTTSRVGLCRLIKYALLSIIVIWGLTSKATTGSGGSESNEVPRYLYTASAHEISLIDKQTLERKVLAGNLAGINGKQNHYLGYPKELVAGTNYLYFYNDWAGKIQRVYTGDDSKSAIENIVPHYGFVSGDGINFNSLAVNDTQAFWVRTNGQETSYIHGKKFGRNDLPKVLTSVSNVARLRAASNALFIATCCSVWYGTPSIFKYNLVTETLELVQSDIVPGLGMIRTALSATEFFWVNGDTIYRMPQSSITPQVLVTGLPNILHITADESTLYALDYNAQPKTIYKI